MPKTNKTSASKINKSAWIRSQPATLSAADVVTKAKGQGISLSLAQVYVARSNAKKRVDEPRGKPGPKPKLKPAAISGDNHEHHFRNLVLHALGRTRAQEILNELASIGL